MAECFASYSDRAPKNVRIVIFLLVLICSVMMTCTGNSIKAKSVTMLTTPTVCQKAAWIHYQ
jgi:hypothetical protein